ncbi:hypothetical protein SAY87_024655 [Trapa incisa]|uniref:Uncharacterized protein n=1 Tax=Trapa incisa TaxID=236973 RepID=A0AAN7JFK2_9MYRT|nr:hypothetical protein SAY87_024655 [Trapa incisa]
MAVQTFEGWRIVPYFQMGGLTISQRKNSRCQLIKGPSKTVRITVNSSARPPLMIRPDGPSP